MRYHLQEPLPPEPPCSCPQPGFCERFQIQQDPHAHAVCQGTNCPKERSEAYRRKWRMRLEGNKIANNYHQEVATSGMSTILSEQRELQNREAIKLAKARTPQAPPVPKQGPGTELKKILEQLGFRIANCSCAKREEKMNEWGIAGCKNNRKEILSWLEEQSKTVGLLSKGIAALKALTSGLAFQMDPLRPLESILDEAIHRAEVGKDSP